jgi:hypothetical protein
MTVAVVFAISLALGGWLGVRYSESKRQVDLDLDWLRRVEAERDVWESDELWAAHQRLTDPATPPAGSVTPTAAVDSSASVSGGGGHLLRDELIEELVSEYRTKLYEWFH